MHTRASGSEQNLTSVFLLIGGLGEAKMEDEFVLEMWELKLVFKSQINPKKLRNEYFSILCLARFQSCSFMDLRRETQEMSKGCKGHSSDKTEPGRNDCLNFINQSPDDMTV